MVLSYLKVSEEALEPVFSTKGSACFDLSVCFNDGEEIEVYSPGNALKRRTVVDKSVLIYPGDRMKVPTGLIFDIEKGYSVRLHSRSGLSLKQGLVLVNGEAVIDWDYVDPCYILLTNTSAMQLKISHGERIAQGEVVVSVDVELKESKKNLTKKTNRKGGLGSTGV